MTRRGRAAATIATLLLATALLGSCTTRITLDPLAGDGAAAAGDAEVTLTATLSASSDVWIVRLPASRPASGVRVAGGPESFFVPPGHYPPSGACRIWQPGVPPGQQGPPGDCDRLERQVPVGAYLIYG